MKARTLLGLAMLGVILAVPAGAATRKQELTRKETFTPADAEKAQVYIKAAMAVPMADLLKKADLQHPDIMLEYGLGLYLGRDPVTANMAAGDRELLKKTYRGVLDLYLNSSDKFGDVTFDEDAMLDDGDFWIYLAEHIGRPKEQQQLNQTMPGGGGGGEAAMVFMSPDRDNSDTTNLNNDLILKRQVVNAATTCTASARSFARMAKAQTVDISETKLTPDKYAEMQVTAIRLYRTAYVLGVQACASKENFDAAAAFAAQHLGVLGTKKDDPKAKVADVSADAAS